MKTLVFALGLLCAAVPAFSAPEIGKPAPGFTVKDATGADRSLADFKGKTVVLEWFDDVCPFTQKHYRSGTMQKLQKAATDDGVVWLTVNSSGVNKAGYLTPTEAVAKMKEFGMNSTALLLDVDGKVGHLYEARTTPEMYVVDGKGVLVYKGAIDNRPTPDPASLADATPYVRNALAAVKAGRPVTPSETKSYGCAVKY
jgi:hypothetical protein